MKILICILGWIVLVAGGIFVDIHFLLVPGINEIVHGSQASPVSTNSIVWGALHILFFGVGVGVAGLLGCLWTMLFGFKDLLVP